MSNLLPRETLQAVRSTHRARFVLVGSLVGIICGVIALLALAPAYAVVTGERAASNDAAQDTSLESSTDRADVTRARELVKEFLPVATATTSVLTILDEVLAGRPAGIVITSMSVRRGNPGEIVLNGTAPSRNEINAYREVLSKNTRFESVSVPVPIGILTSSQGGAFSATLTGSF